MSDDPNINPFTGEPRWFGDALEKALNKSLPSGIGTETACHYCGQPVTPDQAYLCEQENRDGGTYTIVFHSSIDQLCALKWGAERLENIAGRLEAILALFGYVNDGRD
jgi:hypothetical protein